MKKIVVLGAGQSSPWVPKHRVFDCTWPVEVEGVGPMTAYPNRDSLAYRCIFGLTRARTLIRGTATLVEHGEPGGVTAMARAVGLPAALAARLVLDGEIDLVGCHIPTEPAGRRHPEPRRPEPKREGVIA